MNKLDKFLLSVFGIFLIIIITFFIYTLFFLEKTIEKDKVVISTKVIKKYIPYENKTFGNIKDLNKKIKNSILSLKNDIIDYNKKLVYSPRLRIDYFEFYAKYKKNINFIYFLQNEKVFLQDFEKKILLGRLHKSEKLINGLNLEEVNFPINTELLGKNKRIVYNKKKRNVRIQYFDTEENRWSNIYFGYLDFDNLNNEYIYNIKFIDKKDKNGIFGIVYTLKENMTIERHYIKIDYKDDIILKIKNIDKEDIFNIKRNSKDCSEKLQYLAISNNKKEVNFFCYDEILKNNKKINIINNN